MTPAYQDVVHLSRSERAHALRHLYRMEPAIAVLALAALAPILLIVAGIIAALARKTPLVRHRRVGWHGSELPMLKLRTMWDGSGPRSTVFTIEDVADAVPAAKNGGDRRVTSRFAAWCRRFSIDELPQLYHVARGEMSLVGPRPITRRELEEHYGPYAQEVVSLKPGLTGLWQVMGRSRLSYSRRRDLDLVLVRSASPSLYFRILLRTIPGVLKGHDAY